MKLEPADHGLLNLDDSWELHFWMAHLCASEEQLRAAVLAVGKTALAVRLRLHEAELERLNPPPPAPRQPRRPFLADERAE